jgi:hypothetical protein
VVGGVELVSGGVHFTRKILRPVFAGTFAGT